MKYVFSMTLALALLATAPALADGRIDVMTQNQYLGADLGPVITAPDPVAFNAALVEALEQIAANNYPARVEQLANLIADRQPELVGLQEMFKFECEDEGVPTQTPGFDCSYPPIANAFNDHLEETLDALADTYDEVAIVNNLDLTGNIIPGFPDGLPVDLDFNGLPDITVTVLDRDVILARGDVATTVVPFGAFCNRPSVDGCNYDVVAEVPGTPIGDIQIERGFVGVDAVIDGNVYRFVNTHLEVQFLVGDPGVPGVVPLGFIQAAQATELNGLVAASLQIFPAFDHVIIVGDINSGPTDGIFQDPAAPNPPFPPGTQFNPPYMQLANGVGLTTLSDPSPLGPLTDAWDFVKPANEPGFSCCQLADLSNPQSILDERIDVIFAIEVKKNVKNVHVLGAEIQDKTLPGPRLWPSDHGSVAAELRFK